MNIPQILVPLFSLRPSIPTNSCPLSALSSIFDSDGESTNVGLRAQIVVAAAVAMAEDQPPRPAIGGQRISLEWLHGLGERECLWRFRFTAGELERLTGVLRIRDPYITSRCGYCFSAIEALSLLCARLRSSHSDLFSLTTTYHRSETALSEVINQLCMELEEKWRHLLDFDYEGILSPNNLVQYADAVHRAGAPILTVYGFIDCTVRHVCRPISYQRCIYTGHKHFHGLKYQGITVPNGLIAHLFGPVEGCRNDNALLADSNIIDKCFQYALRPGVPEDAPVTERYFQLFGYPAYGLSVVHLSPFSRADGLSEQEQGWNSAMGTVRMAVENTWGVVLSNWPFLNAFWKQRVLGSPVGCYYRVGVLLSNALNCLRPNQVAQFFDCQPPLLEEYFHV